MKKFLSMSLAVLLVASMFVGCREREEAENSSNLSSSSESSAADDKETESKVDEDFSTSITVKGVGEEEFTFTMDEVKAFEPVVADVKSTTSNGEINTASVIATNVADLLSDKGFDIKDFESLKIIASDGYEILVPKDVLENRDVLLAYQEDDIVYDKFGAFRSIIPDERAMYWVKGVAVLDFEQNITSSNIEKVTFLDNIGDAVELVDYEYYESTDKAVSITDLFGEFTVLGDETSGTLIASDGLEDDKDIDTLQSAYLKLTGDGAPLFTSYDMPKGMQIKGIVYLKAGNTCFTSVTAMGGSIDLQSVLSDSGLTATNYIAVGVDGSETDLVGGILGDMQLICEEDTLYLVNEAESIKIEILEIKKK